MISIFRAAKSFKKRVSLKVKRLAPQAKASEVSTDELYLPTFSNSKAKDPIGDDIITVVTASATGEGVHTRWIHPEESVPISPQSSLLPASSASSLTLLSSNDEMENKKLIIKIPASKKRPTIKIPASKLHASGAFAYDGCSDTKVTEKLSIAVPASKKRSRSTDDEEAIFVRHTRRRPTRLAPAPCPAIIVPTQHEGDLIYSGLNKYADPVVVTTSATAQGTHTRWLYPMDVGSTSTSTDSDADHSGWDAEDEGFCGFDSDVPQKNEKLTIAIPPLTSLKRTRDSEDDEDCPARCTRSRFSASSPSATISTISTTSSRTSSNPSLVIRHGTCYTYDLHARSPALCKAIRTVKRSREKSKKN